MALRDQEPLGADPEIRDCDAGESVRKHLPTRASTQLLISMASLVAANKVHCLDLVTCKQFIDCEPLSVIWYQTCAEY